MKPRTDAPAKAERCLGWVEHLSIDFSLVRCEEAFGREVVWVRIGTRIMQNGPIVDA